MSAPAPTVGTAAVASDSNAPASATGKPRFVIDTNVVLDLWLYADPHTVVLRSALGAQAIDWVATARMREELARVLAYPHIAARLLKDSASADDVLAQFDGYARMVAAPAKASVTCKDPDDQCFIDLAVAQQASCVSKDKAVLTMARRLEKLGAGAAKPQGFAAVLQAATATALGASAGASVAGVAKPLCAAVLNPNDSALASAQ